METKKIKVPGTLYSNYIIEKKPDAKLVCLCLHGYAEAGDYFFNKLKKYLPKEATIVSPNGPFLVPVLTQKGYRMGHSWYFYDGRSDEYIVDMSIAIEYVYEILKQENLLDQPVRIIGYSQGGYLAPFVGLKLSQTKQVIGLNCQFLDDEIKEASATAPKFRMDALNGKKDEVVEYKNALHSVENLKKRGVKATFGLVDNGNHHVKEEFLEKLPELLKNNV